MLLDRPAQSPIRDLEGDCYKFSGITIALEVETQNAHQEVRDNAHSMSIVIRSCLTGNQLKYCTDCTCRIKLISSDRS